MECGEWLQDSPTSHGTRAEELRYTLRHGIVVDDNACPKLLGSSGYKMMCQAKPSLGLAPKPLLEHSTCCKSSLDFLGKRSLKEMADIHAVVNACYTK